MRSERDMSGGELLRERLLKQYKLSSRFDNMTVNEARRSFGLQDIDESRNIEEGDSEFIKALGEI